MNLRARPKSEPSDDKQEKVYSSVALRFAGQCFWVANLKSRLVEYVSPQFEMVFHRPSSVLSRGLDSFAEVVHPDDKDRVLSEFFVNLERGFATDLRIVGSDGEIRWLNMQVGLFVERQEQRADPKMMVVCQDITDRKILDESHRDAEVRQIESSRLHTMTELASGVAHEINNPLTIIVGKAFEMQSLLEEPELSREKLKEIADKIESTGMRISQIVSSLKALSRKDGDLELQCVHFNQIFDELKDLFSEKFREHKIELTIPQFPADFAVEVHRTLITQVFFNLISNAFDAIEKLDQRWVRVDFASDEDSVFIFVTDSGSGIPIKLRGRIFDPFFTTKPPSEGTGLGLSLASNIMQRHGGSVRIDNLSVNTRFAVQIPRRRKTNVAA